MSDERKVQRRIRLPATTEAEVLTYARRHGLSINGAYNVLIRQSLDRIKGNEK